VVNNPNNFVPQQKKYENLNLSEFLTSQKQDDTLMLKNESINTCKSSTKIFLRRQQKLNTYCYKLLVQLLTNQTTFNRQHDQILVVHNGKKKEKDVFTWKMD